MTTTKKKKSAREKRVLVASIICAAAIVAGSTFAWFTSKDEVTNRLSANAKYDVSIAEDFQPPEEWIPGQTINKDVSAVNTGNVDAFVRMWLGGQMRLLNEETTNMIEAVKPSDRSLTSTLTAVTDKDKLDLGLTWQKTAEGSTTPVYYRTLSTKQIDNALDANHATNPNEETNHPATFSEVQSVQAGGVLVMAPENAGYHWTLEQATELPNYGVEGDTNAPTMQNLAKGTIVGTSKSSYSAKEGETFVKITGSKTEDGTTTYDNYYGAIDASTFQPETEGLYIFRRNVKETDDGTANTYEYSGYYYVPASGSVPEQYFALHTGTGANGKSDYVLPQNVINDNSTASPSNDQVLPVTIANGQKVYLYTATEKVIETGTDAANLKWEYHAPVTNGTPTDLEKNGYFTVTYNNGTETTDDDIVINVALANIKGATGVDNSESWTAISGTTANHTTTFYYNNDVEAGDTTTKLVDSVKLADTTTNDAYLAFDFDLNVFLESVQVTMDETGKELIDPAKAQFTTAPTNGTAITADKVEATNTNAEITSIEWNKTTGD